MLHTYRHTHGAALSAAEAAHLLTRAAQGEAMTHAPVKEGSRYHLAHVATLSEEQRQRYRAQVQQVAAALALFTAPSLHA